MNEQEFLEKNYLWKILRYKGNYFKIPDVRYLVTAALYQHDSDGNTIFAIMSENYNPPKNVDWFTIHLRDDELEKLNDFEILN